MYESPLFSQWGVFCMMRRILRYFHAKYGLLMIYAEEKGARSEEAHNLDNDIQRYVPIRNVARNA